MKYLFLALSLALLAESSVAQSLPSKSTLFQAPGDMEPVPAEAVYRVERTEVPGKTRLDSVYYVASKRLLRIEASQWQPNGDTLTKTTAWRANGNLYYRRHQLGNKTHGEYLSYDGQGRLQQKVMYERGKKISAECFSETGAPVACTEYEYKEKMPVPPGGSAQAMLQYIGKSLRYPKEALKKKQQGKIMMTFVIDETGALRNIQVKQGISPALDAEALRVLKTLPPFEPAQQNGETVPVYFTVPVTFAIR